MFIQERTTAEVVKAQIYCEYPYINGKEYTLVVLSVKQNRVAYAIRSLINEKKFEVGGKEWSLLEGKALSGMKALIRIIMVHQNRFTQVNYGGLTSTLIDLSLSLSISLSLSL